MDVVDYSGYYVEEVKGDGANVEAELDVGNFLLEIATDLFEKEVWRSTGHLGERIGTYGRGLEYWFIWC